MEAIEAILTRRSTRKYTDKVPERELVEKVIEAGRYAPSGHNNQSTHFFVFSKKELLSGLAELVKDEFAKMEADDNTYVSLKGAINAAKTGNYVFHYGGIGL